ncbi:Unknown protein sequence [Pseudomonas ficuserectae]|nr:Unknown protein sequence [Pseudomonas ficuserectae]
MPGGSCLQPQGFIEQDHFEQLAIHREERQHREAETTTAADQTAFDIVLPCGGMTTVVHPHTKPEHHYAGKQRGGTFQQFTLCAADVDDVGRQRPGAQPGQQSQTPADVDAAHRRLLAGIAQKRQNRRQYQNRFQSFTQQNQQARNVAQRQAQTIAAQQPRRFLELAFGRFQLLGNLRQRQAVLQGLSVSHQAFFSVLAHIGVYVIQRAFDQFETFQIRCHRQVIGLLAITGLVGSQAFVKRYTGVIQQLCRAALHLWRLRALDTKGCAGIRTLGCLNYGRCLTSQVGDVEGLGWVGNRLCTETGDIGRDVPALAVVQLVGKCGHIGTGDAQPGRVVEIIKTQAIQPCRVTQV